jgi:hypothetical protein
VTDAGNNASYLAFSPCNTVILLMMTMMMVLMMTMTMMMTAMMTAMVVVATMMVLMMTMTMMTTAMMIKISDDDDDMIHAISLGKTDH